MTTCNNVILAQPDADSSVSYTIPEGDSARLNFNPDEIAGLQIGDNGELIISFENGGQLTITNFEELADAGSLVYLNDGTLIDPTTLTSSAQSPDALNDIATAAGDADPIIIKQPEANTRQEISIESGMKYVCDFDPANAATVETKNGQMVLTFADGSQVVINNYETAMAGELPPKITVAEGVIVGDAELTDVTEATQFVEIAELLEISPSDTTESVETIEAVEEVLEIAQESIAEQIANVEPAAGEPEETSDVDLAALAESLADIETAAGEEGGSAGSNGYGFNSKPTDVPLNSPDAIGPLGATKLAYDAPEVRQENVILNAAVPDDIPTISVENLEVDDTDLSNGNNSVSGTATVDFGNDTPGSIVTTGMAQVVCPFGSNQLTSQGVLVNITSTTNGYVGTANGQTVFTFDLDPVSGDYTFTQIAQIDHAESNDPNDVVCLNLGIQAIDADGDNRASNVQITILDDGPVVVSQADNIVDETNFDNGPLVVTNTFAADMGQDVGGTYAGNNVFEVNGSLDNGALTSNGNSVTVTFDAGTNTYTAVANSETVFTLEVNPINGEYTYSQFGPLDHADATDPNDIINLDFGIQITDFDGDSADGKIRIQVLDDAPITGDDSNTIDETNLDNPIVINDSVDVDFGNDGQGTLVPNDTFTSTGSQTNGQLTSGGVAVVVTQTANGYVGVANGLTVFTLEIEPTNGDYTFTLNETLDHADGNNPNDIISLNFGTIITDYDGDSDPGTITINIKDDSPVANDDTESLDNDENTVDGNVLNNDDNGADAHGMVCAVKFDGQTVDVPEIGTVNIVGQFGTLTIATDGSYTYARSGQEGGTDTFTYIMKDGDGDTSEADLTINVTKDHNPIEINGVGATDDTNLVNGDDVETGIINVDYQGDGPGTTTGNGTFASSGNQTDGTLTSNGVPINVVFNPDTNTYTGITANIHGVVKVAFTMVINDDGTYTFTQIEPLDHSNTDADNEALFLDFGVTATDADGDTGTGTVRITVRDDAPEAEDDKLVVEDGNTANGNVLTNDDLSADDSTTVTSINFEGNEYPVTAGTETVVEGNFGTLTIEADGSYSYQANPNAGGTGNINCLDVTPADVAGTQSSITKNGVTVTSVNGGDLTFTDGGIGVFDGGGSNRVYGNDEALDVDFAPSTEVTLTMGDLGNNPTSAMDFTIHLSDGTTQTVEIPVTDIPQVNHAGSVTFTAADYGAGVTIVGVNVFSHDTGSNFSKTSFSLIDVKATEPGSVEGEDNFTYTITDADGDTSTANLDVCVENNPNPIEINGVGQTDDTNLAAGPDVETGVINVNYQGNEPGETCGDGNFDSSGNRTNNSLTSNGVAVNVTFDAATNTYTGVAGGTTVFTMVINDDATYTFTQIEQLDHSDTNDNNEGLFLDFGVKAVDADGDTGTGTVRITVLDDAPEAADDKLVTEDGGTANGNVLTNDDLSADNSTTVTSVQFEGADHQVTPGSVTTIQANAGTLTITADGTYNYEANTGETQTVYSFDVDTPSGRDAAGDVLNSTGSFNSTTNEFNFSFVISGQDANGFTLVMNDGPNPKNHPGEMAIFYFDASGTGEPVISAYGYNGANSMNSFKDGSSAAGIQAPDRILGSEDANNPFTNISVTTDANGNQVFSFSMDATAINEHNPAYTEAGAEWTGVAFNELMGIWFHPVSGLETDYDADGNLTAWNIDDQSWWDNSNMSTTTTVIPGQQTVGEDSFTYTITDADGDTDTATLDICVEEHTQSSIILRSNLEEFEHGNPGRWDFTDTYHEKYYGRGNEAIEFNIGAQLINAAAGEVLDHFIIEMPDVLADFGVIFNKGTEVTNGVWKIGAADISDLELQLPGLEPVDGKTWKNPDYIIPQGTHDFDVSAYSTINGHVVNSAEIDVEVIILSSPLVLDLDGDGVELLNIDDGVTFDMDQDGQAEQTAWVDADDGLLALDKNGDGEINDRSELFGNTDGFSDGFANLASYDDNADGVIDAADAIYSDLTVWQDADTDGVSDEGEMLSLMDIGVVSIFLNADMPEDLIVEGNWISHTSTFLTDTGETHDIVDAWFETRELSETELGAIEEATDTLLTLEALDISQMLETSDDVTEAIQDFVHNTDNADTAAIGNNDNAQQSEGGFGSTQSLEELPQGSSDQVLI